MDRHCSSLIFCFPLFNDRSNQWSQIRTCKTVEWFWAQTALNGFHQETSDHRTTLPPPPRPNMSLEMCSFAKCEINQNRELTSSRSNSNPPRLSAVGDLREETDWREQLGHGLRLEMVVVDAMEDDVNNVHQKVDQVGSVTLNQQLNLKWKWCLLTCWLVSSGWMLSSMQRAHSSKTSLPFTFPWHWRFQKSVNSRSIAKSDSPDEESRPLLSREHV